jgi:NAD(P)-dependent dehydrogenase (short-subunit alcohol dehydrogenase family)
VVLDLKGKKVVVTGGKHSIGRAIAEAVAREGADIIIWLRKCNDELNEANLSRIAQLEIPSQLSTGAVSSSLGVRQLRTNHTGDPSGDAGNLRLTQKFLE